MRRKTPHACVVGIRKAHIAECGEVANDSGGFSASILLGLVDLSEY